MVRESSDSHLHWHLFDGGTVERKRSGLKKINCQVLLIKIHVMSLNSLKILSILSFQLSPAFLTSGNTHIEVNVCHIEWKFTRVKADSRICLLESRWEKSAFGTKGSAQAS